MSNWLFNCWQIYIEFSEFYTRKIKKLFFLQRKVMYSQWNVD